MERAWLLLMTLALVACATLTPQPEPMPTATSALPSLAPFTPTATSVPPSPTLLTPTPTPRLTSTISPKARTWVLENAVPFDTIEPGSGYSDLEPLRGIIGDARIVALGEATHGTHEFFRMKHRILEFLVEEMGFSIFAMEASWAECNPIDDYVQTGEGDLEELLGDLFRIWNAQEVLDMIRWMQECNALRGDAQPLYFSGFDMQSPRIPMDNVIAYLQTVDPAAEMRVVLYYDCLRRYQDEIQAYADLPANTQAACREDLEAAYDWLTERETDYTARSSPRAFAHALQSARLVLQAEDVWADFLARESYNDRDRYMAQNVAWLLDQAGPNAKIVLWAHNGHVAMAADFAKPMGAYLHEWYGDEMVVLGFSFYRGAFNEGHPEGMAEYRVASPPEGSYAHYFHSAGLPLFYLDLRRAGPGSPATDWLFESRPNNPHPQALSQGNGLPYIFDVVVYFEDTTPSMLLGEPAFPAEMPTAQPAVSLSVSAPINLDFEEGISGWTLSGAHPDRYEIGVDGTTVHSGSKSGYIRSTGGNVNRWAAMAQGFAPAAYRGQRMRMSAYVKTQDVWKWAGLWMRVDGPAGMVSLDNMYDRAIWGNTDWTRYEIVLDVPEDSTHIAFGAILSDDGQVWVDDLEFEVVGEDVPTTQ